MVDCEHASLITQLKLGLAMTNIHTTNCNCYIGVIFLILTPAVCHLCVVDPPPNANRHYLLPTVPLQSINAQPTQIQLNIALMNKWTVAQR